MMYSLQQYFRGDEITHKKTHNEIIKLSMQYIV